MVGRSCVRYFGQGRAWSTPDCRFRDEEECMSRLARKEGQSSEPVSVPSCKSNNCAVLADGRDETLMSQTSHRRGEKKKGDLGFLLYQIPEFSTGAGNSPHFADRSSGVPEPAWYARQL